MKPDYMGAFPNRTAPCLCGSGERFKNCCSKALTAHFGGDQVESQRPTSLKERIKTARYELALYRVWHVAHTRAGLSFPQQFHVNDQFLVDIRAMSEYLERLLWLYRAANRASAIQPTISALARAIDDPRWSERIRLLALVWRHHASWDVEVLRVELEKLDINATRDPAVLELYLDVCGRSIGLSRYRELCQVVVSETDEPVHRLQYRFLAALRLDLHGDHETATREVTSALSSFETEVDESDLDSYGHLQYARALRCKAAWCNDSQETADIVRKAVASLEAALSSGELNAAGQANILQEMGKAYALAGRWDEVLDAARRSTELNPTFLATLLEIQAALQSEQYDLAREHLDRLPYADLPPQNQFDHSLSLAEVACAEGDLELCTVVRERLLAVDTKYPYFRDRIASLVAKLADREKTVLLQELKDARRQATECFDPMRLSDTQLRSVLSHHQCLPPHRQARTLPGGLELPDMLGEVLQRLCRVLLDQRALLTTEMRSQEDTYSGFIALQLQAQVASLGWHVTSQDYGGLSATANIEFGRRDITIRKAADAPFAIIEAVRCGATTDSAFANLQEHADRLLKRYDRARSAELFSIIFVENVPIEQFTAWYCESYRNTVPLASPSAPSLSELPSTPVKVFQGKHATQSGTRLVSHILLEIN